MFYKILQNFYNTSRGRAIQSIDKRRIIYKMTDDHYWRRCSDV